MKNFNSITAALAVSAIAAIPLSANNDPVLAEAPDRCTNASTNFTPNAEITYEQMAKIIPQLEFFALDSEYNYYNQQHYQEFFAAKGMNLLELDEPNEGDFKLHNEWLFELAAVPQSFINASGIKNIVVLPTDPDRDYSRMDDYSDIPHNGDTIWVNDWFDVYNAVGIMILDNYCDAQAVEATLRAYSEEDGLSYDADFEYDFRDENNPHNWELWKARYGNTFSSPEAMLNPRSEFVLLFRDFIQGWALTDEDLSTGLGKKQALVRRIANAIEPNIEAWLTLNNYAGAVGTHGLPPQRLLNRVLCMNEYLATATTEEERDHIFRVDYGDAEPDPRYPSCDRLLMLPYPSLFFLTEQQEDEYQQRRMLPYN